MLKLISDFDNAFFDNGHWNLTTLSDYELIENDNEYIFNIYVPGIKKEDIGLDLKNNVLTVKAVRKYDEKTKRMINNIKYGEFETIYTLPDDAGENVDASLQEGVLTIKINKQSKRKQIEIR